MKDRSKIWIRLILAVILLLIGAGSPWTVKAAETAPVRVGCFYQTASEEGAQISGYDREYLDKISEYSGLKFEYVDCGTWEQALWMLENHEVDLVGTMQWNEQREEDYEFCLESYGYTVGELAVLEDSGIVFEDYDSIEDAVVGYLYDYVRRGELENFFEEHGISPEVRIYESQDALEQAFASGKIDIIAENSHMMKPEWRVVEKFSYSPFYFVSRKENEELTDQLDNAIIRINLYEPLFGGELIHRYFPVVVGTPFTKEEYNLIESGGTYTIYFDGGTKPLVWYDEKSESMRGVLVDICAQLREITGIDFQVQKKNGTEDLTDASSVTYSTLYYDSALMKSARDGVTDAILDETFNFYHRLGDPYDSDEGYRVAIVKSRDGLQEYMRTAYPDCTLVEYDTPSECIRHLRKEDVDLAYLNTHVAENIITLEDASDILEIPTNGTVFGLSLRFHGQDRELLAGIVNKAMKLVDQESVEDLMLQYALDTGPKITLTYLMKEHFALGVCIIVLTFLVLLALAVLATYAKVMKREKNRVEMADQARTDFFARMSHDMRTPMNGILGMIGLTKDAVSMEEVKSNMTKAESAGNYMLSLINDTLDLQRLESGKLKFDTQIVYIRDFIDNMLEMVRPSAEQKKVVLSVNNVNVDFERYIRIDPIRVKQIFMNLLSNAIKFTPEGGTIEITIECLGVEKDISHERITISDTGIGISPEFIERQLFKAYAQEQSEVSNQYAGSGLGLAITKNLIDLMKGRITVESELGEGTTFEVFLDFEVVEGETAVKSQEKENEMAHKTQALLPGKRILLCEDHPLNAEIARRLLEKAGCEIVWAQDGQKGLELFEASKEGSFDAVLMDIRMPVMNGLEAAKAIRALNRPDAKAIPIFAMTANAYDTDIKMSREAGMNEHLAKPIQPQVLYSTLALYFGGGGQ